MIDVMDKATITAHYDDTGRCRTVIVYLNDSVVSADDVAAAVRAVFRPDHTSTWNAATRSNHLVRPDVHINGREVPDHKPSGWF